jgi:hypothetical protein
MQTREVRDRDDVAVALLDDPRRWRVAIEGQVGARLVVIGRVSTQHPGKVAFTERDDVVGAVASDRSDHALGEGVLPVVSEYSIALKHQDLRPRQIQLIIGRDA